MSHYFITPNDDGTRHEVTATIWDVNYRFVAAPGVFSARKLDLGTFVLFRESQPPAPDPARILDLGCGFGPIGIALATQCRSSQIDTVDVNALALQLTTENAHRAGVGDRVHAITPEQVDPEVRYDQIWSNPPIRIGKQALHDLLLTWLPRLTDDGVARMVVGKNLGADSLANWLNEQGWETKKVASAKGFRILEIRRAAG